MAYANRTGNCVRAIIICDLPGESVNSSATQTRAPQKDAPLPAEHRTPSADAERAIGSARSLVLDNLHGDRVPVAFHDTQALVGHQSVRLVDGTCVRMRVNMARVRAASRLLTRQHDDVTVLQFQRLCFGIQSRL